MKLIDPLIIIFQKRIQLVIKNFPNTYKREEIKAIFHRSLKKNRTFESNLNEYMSKHYQNIFQAVSAVENFQNSQNMVLDTNNSMRIFQNGAGLSSNPRTGS
jgi:hypothetical protein